ITSSSLATSTPMIGSETVTGIAIGLPPRIWFQDLKGHPEAQACFYRRLRARSILYRRLGERRRGEISHGLYWANSQKLALSLLLPSSPTIQAGLSAIGPVPLTAGSAPGPPPTCFPSTPAPGPPATPSTTLATGSATSPP